MQPAAELPNRDHRCLHGDDGYVLIMVGLLLVPLMIFAALAVDVSAWYARGAQMQKAADAAALAGVVWLPDQAKAKSVANGVLTQDGFTSGGNISVTYAFDSTTNKMTVTLRDAHAPEFFSSVFATPISLSRSAVAQYSLPIPLGSPDPFFGGDWTKSDSGTTTTEPNTTTKPITTACKVAGYTGGVVWWDAASPSKRHTGSTYPAGSSGWPTCTWPTSTPLPTYYTSPGFWANIMGPASDATNGDAFSPQCYNGRYCTTATTDDGDANYNELHDNHSGPSAAGYRYTISVPKAADGGVATSVAIQVFDAGHYPGNAVGVSNIPQSPTGDNIDQDSSKGFTTNYSVDYQSNPLDISSVTPASCGAVGGDGFTNAGTWALATNTNANLFRIAWMTICTVTIQPGQTYVLNVKSTGPGDGSNRYALRAIDTSTGALPTNPVSIAAYGDMAVYNNLTSGVSKFYLAKIGPEYAGKVLNISLWDTGDITAGSTPGYMSVIPPGPSETPQQGCSFSAAYLFGSSAPPPGTNPAGGIQNPTGSKQNGTLTGDCSIAVKDASGGNSNGNFNGLWLNIVVKIPNTYTCDTSLRSRTATSTSSGVTKTSCWWSVYYNIPSSANDNTTWRAAVAGSPVHLTG